MGSPVASTMARARSSGMVSPNGRIRLVGMAGLARELAKRRRVVADDGAAGNMMPRGVQQLDDRVAAGVIGGGAGVADRQHVAADGSGSGGLVVQMAQVVRPARLELATSWFVARRSIQ